MTVQTAYQTLYGAALLYLTVLMAVMLYRAVRSAGAVNRLIAVNMTGTLVNGAVLVLSALLRENWLTDVALIYTMISFVSVLVLVRVMNPAEPETASGETEGERHA